MRSKIILLAIAFLVVVNNVVLADKTTMYCDEIIDDQCIIYDSDGCNKTVCFKSGSCHTTTAYCGYMGEFKFKLRKKIEVKNGELQLNGYDYNVTQ